jgi:predicted Fe-S protein YdhL (DUF1289 family)
MDFDRPNPIVSPCVGLCELGSDGFCVGCLRSVDEITRWINMSEGERRWIMDHVLIEREAMRR